MSLPIKKIISASAGTGKTYRLSLEYLALILKYYGTQEFKPDQILVITFTRKATAEIRERIFKHLETLSNHKDNWQDLAINLKQLIDKERVINQENPLSEEETRILALAYHHLITHKDELQVMTIDSYVHSIFRNLVRPVRGIDRFELDLKAVDKRMPFLFNELMTPALLKRIESLLSRRIKPSLDEYKLFFKSLIDNRWLYYLASKRSVDAKPNSLAYFTVHPELWQERADEYKNSFLDKFKEIIICFNEYLQVQKNITMSSQAVSEGLFNREFLQLFNPLPVLFKDFEVELDNYLQDDYILQKLLEFLSKDKYMWNGQKVRVSKTLPQVDDWKKLHCQSKEYLSNYLIFHLFLPEQREILDIWQDVLQHYDKLIYRYKNFTYDDIAWFTFEALYSSYPPLFEAEPESTANEFYEFMCHRTRFMLIDEFQDTSILQFSILSPMIDELLSGAGSFPYGGLIVVGDEKQSIFGWRGGQRDLLLNLDSMFQSGQLATKESLTSSWRSSPTLMKYINGIFGHSTLQEFLTRMPAEWQYTDTEGKKTELEQDTVIQFKLGNYSSHSADNKIDKALRNFIAEMVIPALGSNEDPNRTVAILARRNEELEMIRALLAEYGITSEFQSSKSLLDHPVIKAVFLLLKFAVYHDWYDFLAFLRSDLVLMDGAAIKQVINTISDYEKEKSQPGKHINFSHIPLAKAAHELALSLNLAEIYMSCMNILQTCQIKDKMPLQRDFVNTQRFLDLALDYEQNFQSELPELQGFVRYCEDNRDQEIMQQQDVESSTAVQLLTIHKSKGLEFDSVFVWWNLRSFSGREDNKLSSWVQYSDKSYHCLSDIALTLHYNKVLQNSTFKGIMEEDEKREHLEELNNLYVALTRARNRLYLYAAFDKVGSWDKFWTDLDKDDRLTPPHYAVKSAYDYMLNNAVLQEDGSMLISNTAAKEQTSLDITSPETGLTAPEINLRDILPDWQNPDNELKKKDDLIPDLNWKVSYLENRNNLKGNIAHYYLSKIKYASREEMEQANVLTTRQFGNLLQKDVLSALINKIEAILPDLKELFNPVFDIIYTEYPVFYKGKEYRIDRLMIDSKRKQYLIIDYKTGEIYNAAQLQIYETIIKKVLPQDYKSAEEPKYIEINL